MLSLETEKKKNEKMSTTIPDVFFYSFFHECGWQVIKEKKKKWMRSFVTESCRLLDIKKMLNWKIIDRVELIKRRDSFWKSTHQPTEFRTSGKWNYTIQRSIIAESSHCRKRLMNFVSRREILIQQRRVLRIVVKTNSARVYTYYMDTTQGLIIR